MLGISYQLLDSPCTEFLIGQAQWPADEQAVRKVRHYVFVEEQRVPAALEWDGIDADCLHVLALRPDQEPIGTGRLTSKGKIGRLAVVKPWRNRGIGSVLLRTLLRLGQEQGQQTLYLHAQISALGFYRAHGFQNVGNCFLEAGMLHQRMQYRFTRGSSPSLPNS